MSARPFADWPTWALRALVVVLATLDAFHRERVDAELEIIQRACPIEDDGVPGWWCVTVGGVQ